jgi:hypothetical protein
LNEAQKAKKEHVTHEKAGGKLEKESAVSDKK